MIRREAPTYWWMGSVVKPRRIGGWDPFVTMGGGGGAGFVMLGRIVCFTGG